MTSDFNSLYYALFFIRFQACSKGGYMSDIIPSADIVRYDLSRPIKLHNLLAATTPINTLTL